MNKKLIAAAVVVLAALGLAWYGTVRYLDARRARADKRAYACVDEVLKIVGDGRSDIPPEKLRPLLDEMRELSKICSKPAADLMFPRRLDGAFLTGDYALAEKMMDDVPGMSANWKKGAKAKVRAHAALSRGDKKAALAEFDAFCQSLREAPPDTVECDPSTDVLWSCEALLARNLERMSRLAKEIGEGDRAAKYLAEARTDAKAAVRKAADDPETLEVLKKELASLLK